jgi:hypothetical protein
MSFIGLIVSIVIFTLIATTRALYKSAVAFFKRCAQDASSRAFSNQYSNIATA